MATSHLETYRIADILQWHSLGQLELNPYFQRGSVWTRAAQIYLVDTILRGLPVPKVYMRTKVDLVTKAATREIVDGQQRLRAVIEFARDEFALSTRAKEFRGLTYSSMDDELKEGFLSYSISVDQLLNATDADVLEVFARLNSYTVSLNDPELRHAKYQGSFKWLVHEVAQAEGDLWGELQTFTLRERVRMFDDSLVAEMFGVVLEGVRDGGQRKIDDIYKRWDTDPGPEPGPELTDASVKVQDILGFIRTQLSTAVAGTKMASPPHLLMLFAAVGHVRHGIPCGQIDPSTMPVRDETALSDTEMAQHNLSVLADAMSDPETAPRSLLRYVDAASGTTQRIKSRSLRFPMIYRALLPTPLA